jgi:hypothetical protein
VNWVNPRYEEDQETLTSASGRSARPERGVECTTATCIVDAPAPGHGSQSSRYLPMISTLR